MPAPLFFYSDDLMGYNMGSRHPLNPKRLRLTFDLLDSYGAFTNGLSCIAPSPVSRGELLETHSASYLDALERLEDGRAFPEAARFGFGTGDNPIFRGIMSASCLYTGASALAAQAMIDGAGGGRAAFSIAGGLHHAHRGRAAGFCVLNDCAVALRRLRRRFSRVAYLDIDVHHGDGVQELFYSDPTVLTLSLHESGKTLFPGTGFVHEIGEGSGHGYSINLPFAAYTDDDIWLSAWRSTGLPILRAFEPEAIVLQMGADAHFRDPLAHLCLTAQGWVEAVKDVRDLGIPIVALGGGGYELPTVARMWALATSVLAGLDLPDDTPDSWTRHHDIPALTDHIRPEVVTRDHDMAAVAAAEMVAELRALVGEKYGLS